MSDKSGHGLGHALFKKRGLALNSDRYPSNLKAKKIDNYVNLAPIFLKRVLSDLENDQVDNSVPLDWILSKKKAMINPNNF